jgi:hypothetical protein
MGRFPDFGRGRRFERLMVIAFDSSGETHRDARLDDHTRATGLTVVLPKIHAPHSAKSGSQVKRR